MHAVNDILSIVFQFTLFGLLVYKITGLVRQYLIPFLAQQIQVLKNRQLELVEKEKLVKSTLKRVQRQINHQKRMFILLEKKVSVWHQSMQKQVAQSDRECKIIEAALVQRRCLQGKNLKISKIGLEVLPQVVAKSAADLSEKYQGSAGRVLLGKMLNQLVRN